MVLGRRSCLQFVGLRSSIVCFQTVVIRTLSVQMMSYLYNVVVIIVVVVVVVVSVDVVVVFVTVIVTSSVFFVCL